MRTLNALAWRNLRRHPARTALSAAAVALGTAVITAADVAKQTLLGLEQEGLAAFADQVMGLGLNTGGAVTIVTARFMVFNAFDVC